MAEVGDGGAPEAAAEDAAEVGPPGEPAEPVEAAAEAAVRAGPDGYPRLHLPSGIGCIRLSLNADGSTDMRAICMRCEATLSRTCRPPAPGTRRTSKLYGQGRPIGKLCAWLLHGETLDGHHSREEHRSFKDPSFPQREAARAMARLLEGSHIWFDAERPVVDGDAASGQPLIVP